jgi:hypothetical protein
VRVDDFDHEIVICFFGHSFGCRSVNVVPTVASDLFAKPPTGDDVLVLGAKRMTGKLRGQMHGEFTEFSWLFAIL